MIENDSSRAPPCLSAAMLFAEAAGEALRADDHMTISDAELEAVLTAAVKLYAARAELMRRFPSPLSEKDITLTEVVVVACEMIRVVNLHPFDLCMWYQRPR